jgi:endoglucanase
VILEPDGLALLPSEPWCEHRVDPDLTVQRYLLVNHAVDALGDRPRARTYLDAGHSAWQPIDSYVDDNGDDQDGMATRLIRAGVARARGFYLNASNYQWTADQLGYGAELAARVKVHAGAEARFVVDTSRNGRGPADASDPLHWCNPPGRGLGARPTLDTGVPGVDGYLWIKRPGESDGDCRGGPRAGAWWPEQALELARLSDPPL